MKNVLEVMIYTKTEITMKINSIIIGALMSMSNYFLITLIKFYVCGDSKKICQKIFFN